MSIHTNSPAARRPDLSLTHALWVLAVAAAVGDILTTQAGLQAGLGEGNPVARGAIDALGVGGLLALKTGALAVAAACHPLMTRRWKPIVPLGLALPWLAATLLNMAVLAEVLPT